MYLKVIGRALRPGIPPHNIVQFKQIEAVVDQKPVQALPKPIPTVTKTSEMDPTHLSKRKSSIPLSNRKSNNKRTCIPQDNPVCDPPSEPNQIWKPWTKPPDIQDDPKKFALPEGKDKLVG